MWHTQIQSLKDGRVHRFVICCDAETLSYADVLALWREDPQFRSYFSCLLADSPFAAYRWETPCVTSATLSRDFEFVLLRSDGLARTVDPIAFGSHFRDDLEIATLTSIQAKEKHAIGVLGWRCVCEQHRLLRSAVGM